MSDRLLYLLLIAGVLVAAGLVGKAAYDYRVFRRLNDEGRIAAATVVDLKPAHNRRAPEGRWVVFYRFKTPANQMIDGAVGVRKSRAAGLRVGQSIDVVYDPADPSTTAFEPEQAWAVVVYNERLLVPYLALLMVLAWNALERYRAGRS